MFYSVCFLQYSPILRGLILKQLFERVMFQFYIMLKKLFNNFINCVNKMLSFLDERKFQRKFSLSKVCVL